MAAYVARPGIPAFAGMTVLAGIYFHGNDGGRMPLGSILLSLWERTEVRVIGRLAGIVAQNSGIWGSRPNPLPQGGGNSKLESHPLPLHSGFRRNDGYIT